MKLFECFFKDPNESWIFYERYFDGKESKISKITKKSETFIESPEGNFEYFLDPKIKLKKVQNSKEIIEKKYGTINPGYIQIRDYYWDFKESKYNFDPNIWYLDIETTAFAPINTEICPETITLIQIFDKQKNTCFVLGLEDFNESKLIKFSKKYEFYKTEYNFEVKYIKLNNEKELLTIFSKLIKILKPLIVLAHNGDNFDFIYLYKRSNNYFNPDFCPFNIGKTSLEFNANMNGLELKADGLFFIDSIQLYKKFIKEPRASYSLDYLAQKDLKYGKINHDCFKTFEGFRTGEGYIKPESRPDNLFEGLLYDSYIAGNMNELKKLTKEFFIHYGIIDTYLLKGIIEKFKLTDILITLASKMGCQINEALGTTKPWAQYLTNFCYQSKQILPDYEKIDGHPTLKGGFVKDPIKGRHGLGFSLDVDSMYPLLSMFSFNMSPETYIKDENLPPEILKLKQKYLYDEDEFRVLKLYKDGELNELIEKCKKYNLSFSINGAFFDKSKQGVVPYLVKHIYDHRKKLKMEMLEFERLYQETNDIKYKNLAELRKIQQNAEKISINALFGAISNKFFLLFNQEIGRAITGNGRFFINLCGNELNEFLNNGSDKKQDFWLASDTDSTVGDTLININGKDIKIEDFYNIKGKEIERDYNNFIKIPELIYLTDSVNENFKIETNKVNYIMKHKVKKRFYKVKIKNKEVIITEDHSIMVKRNNKLISIKPYEILKSDILLYKE